jgi:uncharacterized protein (DUF2249 family)
MSITKRGGVIAAVPDGAAGRAARLFAIAAAAKEHSMAQTSEVDVRSLIPAKRHERIFQLVDQLAPGGSFVLVNDHDPKPLYYQLEAEHPKQFSWTYLDKGPEVWRVEIGRLLKAA